MAAEELLHQPDHIPGILHPRRLIAGVHRQLGQADIRAPDRHMGHGDIAQSAPAVHIRAVGEELEGDLPAPCQSLDHRDAHAVGGVFLPGVGLDHDAGVHEHPVFGVRVLRMVGVDGVGVVRAEHEAGGQGPQILLLALPQGQVDAPEHVLEEGGGGALLGAGAHLLVVKAGQDIDRPAVGGAQEAPQGGEDALLVVQAAGGDEFPAAAPDGGSVPAVEVQVAAQKLFLPDAQRLRQKGGERAALLAGKQGEHIHLLIEGEAVVDRPVHVDGHAGNQHQVPVQVHQLGGNAAVLPLHQDPAGNGQGSVQPGGADHAAVALHVEGGVSPAGLVGGVLLELEGGGVRVGGGDIEAVALQLRPQVKGDDAGAVAADVAARPRLKLPDAALQQLTVSVLLQGLPHGGDGVEGCGVLPDEGQGLLRNFSVHSCSPFLPLPPPFGTCGPL